LKRGDIVLMVAPGELGKPRPAIVVQADELGDDTTTVVVCPISSDIRRSPRVRPLVEPSAESGLRLTSQIMTDKLLSLRRDRVRRVIGQLDAAALDALDRALMIVLGLAR
jgi:mRNA interferase MazF